MTDEVHPSEAATAIEWVLQQADQAGRFGAAEAGVSLSDPAALEFVRWGRVSESDKRDRSFVDLPPPWKSQSDVPKGSK